MTEQEAINVLLENVPKCCKMVDGRYQGGFDDWDCDMGQAIRVAVLALQDVQNYQKIGTVEECLKAMVKQKPKAVKNRKLLKDFHGSPYCIQGDCPNCGCESIKATANDYCYVCGQHLKWDENLEGVEDE